MKNFFKYLSFQILTCIWLSSCNTDEEILLTTDRDDAYISDMQLYTPDNRNVVVNVSISEDIGMIQLTVKNGVNIAHLKPRCSLAPEATVIPKMGVWTDFSEPVAYKVISGSKKLEKKYTIIVTEQN